MSEIFDGLRPGPGTEGQVWDHRDVPRFLVGDDDEQDMDQVEFGMKSGVFQEEEMEEDDESVGLRAHTHTRCQSLQVIECDIVSVDTRTQSPQSQR